MECVPEQSQNFLLKLISAMKELIQCQQDMLDAEDVFEVACESSQEARENVRASDHSSSLSGESKLNHWTRLSRMFSCQHELSSCVFKCRDATGTMVLKEAELKALLADSASMQQVKNHLAIAFQDLFLITQPGDGGPAVSWDVIKEMCSLLPGDSSHLFYNVFHPAPFFKFFGIFSRAGCSELSTPLFDASVELLAPMFEVAGANPDVPELEASLGSNYLHGMTMLAALASCSLQKKLAARRADASIRVKVTFDRLATGMRATVVADDKFIGREAEIYFIDRRVRPLFQSRSSRDKSIVLIRGQPGVGKSCLAKQHMCLVQNEFCDVSAVFAHCILGRGGGAVRDALVT
jgi:hypothetical protein